MLVFVSQINVLTPRGGLEIVRSTFETSDAKNVNNDPDRKVKLNHKVSDVTDIRQNTKSLKPIPNSRESN